MHMEFQFALGIQRQLLYHALGIGIICGFQKAPKLHMASAFCSGIELQSS